MEWMATEKKCFLIYSWCSTDRTHYLNTSDLKLLYWIQMKRNTSTSTSNSGSGRLSLSESKAIDCWLAALANIFSHLIYWASLKWDIMSAKVNLKHRTTRMILLGIFHEYKTKLVERIHLALFLHFFLTPKPSGERLHWARLTRLPLPDSRLSCCRPPPTFMDWLHLSLGLSPRA